MEKLLRSPDRVWGVRSYLCRRLGKISLSAMQAGCVGRGAPSSALCRKGSVAITTPHPPRPGLLSLKEMDSWGAGFVVLAFGPFNSLLGSGRDREKEACSVSWSFH